MTPDSIHDTALLTVSAWQREALPTRDEALLMLWRFQAERAERQEWDAHGRADAYSVVKDILRSTSDFFMSRGDSIIGYYPDIDAAPPADAGMREASIVTCCVTGAIPGDGGACGDCDPCLFGEASIPSPVKRLIAEKNSLLHRIGELEDNLAEALTAPGATTKSDGGEPKAERTQRRLAVSDDGLGPMQAIPREPHSGPSDPSPTRSDVPVEELAAFLDPRAFIGNATDRHRYCSPLQVEVVQERARQKARALLETHQIRRK